MLRFQRLRSFARGEMLPNFQGRRSQVRGEYTRGGNCLEVQGHVVFSLVFMHFSWYPFHSCSSVFREEETLAPDLPLGLVFLRGTTEKCGIVLVFRGAPQFIGVDSLLVILACLISRVRVWRPRVSSSCGRDSSPMKRHLRDPHTESWRHFVSASSSCSILQ